MATLLRRAAWRGGPCRAAAATTATSPQRADEVAGGLLHARQAAGLWPRSMAVWGISKQPAPPKDGWLGAVQSQRQEDSNTDRVIKLRPGGLWFARVHSEGSNAVWQRQPQPRKSLAAVENRRRGHKQEAADRTGRPTGGPPAAGQDEAVTRLAHTRCRSTLAGGALAFGCARFLV
jgi:hypothetical protein